MCLLQCIDGQLALKHGVELVSIGNGTASRETDKLAADLIRRVAKQAPQRKLAKIVVSEAGASVYSASAFAAAEFPELDVSLRGAVFGAIFMIMVDPMLIFLKDALPLASADRHSSQYPSPLSALAR